MTNGDSKANSQSTLQRSWWRSIYDRISQTGREPEEDKKEPFKQKQRTPSRFRSQRRHHRTSTQHLSDLGRDITDQPAQGLLHPLKPRPSHIPLHHEYDEVYEVADDDDRLPLSDDDFQRANHLQYEDRPILMLAHSKPHVSKRNSIPCRSGAHLPAHQFEKSSSPVLVGGGSGANGLISRPTSPRTYETLFASSLLAAHTASPRVLTTGPALQISTSASRKSEIHSPDQNTNFTFSGSLPPVPPKDSPENISPKDDETTSRQCRKSSHRREAASVPQGRRDRRTNAWTHSTRPHYLGSPPDEERTLPLIGQREQSTNFRLANDPR